MLVDKEIKWHKGGIFRLAHAVGKGEATRNALRNQNTDNCYQAALEAMFALNRIIIFH